MSNQSNGDGNGTIENDAFDASGEDNDNTDGDGVDDSSGTATQNDNNNETVTNGNSGRQRFLLSRGLQNNNDGDYDGSTQINQVPLPMPPLVLLVDHHDCWEDSF
jgi:hypothetical protein